MDNQIVKNLFEFWTAIGKLSQTFIKADDYQAVYALDSEWPNRVFNVNNNTMVFKDIAALSKVEKLPEKIAAKAPNGFRKSKDIVYVSALTNMALSRVDIPIRKETYSNIFQVVTEDDAQDFSISATMAFGYKVGNALSISIAKDLENIQIFLYKENTIVLGCGIIFFDSLNNAGLHMIGTVPEGRGKGIGSKMTQFLLLKAKEKGVANVVLHASAMGKSIYEKLGFKAYGNLETFKVV